jgi:hypothetical protein
MEKLLFAIFAYSGLRLVGEVKKYVNKLDGSIIAIPGQLVIDCIIWVIAFLIFIVLGNV